MSTRRLDLYLFESGLFTSRSSAQDAIKEGRILVNGKVVTKTSFQVEEDSIEVLSKEHEFASRGGLKLYDAIQTFHITLQDKVVLDIGASTGGFSDVCLQCGARYVYAFDIGKDQLVERLKQDARVNYKEGINCRYLKKEYFDKKIDFICIDVSFISITLIIDSIVEVIEKPWEGVFLIKPQFEAGKQYVGKKGIVKDKKVHKRVLDELIQYFQEKGLSVYHLQKSTVVGRDGNQEYLVHLHTQGKHVQIDTNRVVKEGK